MPITNDSGLDLLCDLLARARSGGADAADAVMMASTDLSVSCRLGKPESLERAESKGLGLRVFVGQRQAVVSSSDITRDNLTELTERAIAMARIAPEDPYATLAPEALLARDAVDLDLYDAVEPSTGWMLEQSSIAEQTAMAVAGITNSEGADANYSAYDIMLATSNGFANHYRSSSISLSLSVLAGEGTGMERDYDFTVARHAADLAGAATIGVGAATKALRRLNPRKIATCQHPILFDPRISKSLLGALAGAISGAAITRGTSFLKEQMGKQVFAKGIRIIDNPHIKRGLGSKPFDAEGLANRNTVLVEDGVLQSWLLDIRSANQLGLAPTGHATRGIASPPSPSSTNLYMDNGTISCEALLKDVKQGFYVTDTFGMGINLITGDYSQGANGFWIENGELAYPVSEVTIAGNLADMFKNLTAASDLTFKYATNAPTIRIDGMTVAGS